MTKSIADIMANKWEEPPEIKQIKAYVLKHFGEDISVGISRQHINIYVPSAAMAASLRMQIHELQKAIKTDKRLVIRIGR